MISGFSGLMNLSWSSGDVLFFKLPQRDCRIFEKSLLVEIDQCGQCPKEQDEADEELLISSLFHGGEGEYLGALVFLKGGIKSGNLFQNKVGGLFRHSQGLGKIPRSLLFPQQGETRDLRFLGFPGPGGR